MSNQKSALLRWPFILCCVLTTVHGIPEMKVINLAASQSVMLSHLNISEKTSYISQGWDIRVPDGSRAAIHVDFLDIKQGSHYMYIRDGASDFNKNSDNWLTLSGYVVNRWETGYFTSKSSCVRIIFETEDENDVDVLFGITAYSVVTGKYTTMQLIAVIEASIITLIFTGMFVWWLSDMRHTKQRARGELYHINLKDKGACDGSGSPKGGNDLPLSGTSGRQTEKCEGVYEKILGSEPNEPLYTEMPGSPCADPSVLAVVHRSEASTYESVAEGEGVVDKGDECLFENSNECVVDDGGYLVPADVIGEK